MAPPVRGNVESVPSTNMILTRRMDPAQWSSRSNSTLYRNTCPFGWHLFWDAVMSLLWLALPCAAHVLWICFVFRCARLLCIACGCVGVWCSALH